MPITATFKGFQKRPDGLKIQVNYDDGEDSGLKVSHFKGSSDKELVNHIRSEANHLEKRKAYDPTRHVGKTIDITPEPPAEVIPPPAEEVDKRQWFADYAKLKEINLLFNNAPALATTQAITARDNLQADVENNWLNSYLGDL